MCAAHQLQLAALEAIICPFQSALPLLLLMQLSMHLKVPLLS
jgi:hypothetical protein